jgi:hypothetical protein
MLLIQVLQDSADYQLNQEHPGIVLAERFLSPRRGCQTN